MLTTKEKPAGRINDPDLAEKMKAEVEGIFLWAFECLQRLVANNFKFTESDRIRENREAVKRDNNNIFDFMDSEGYIQRKACLLYTSRHELMKARTSSVSTDASRSGVLRSQGTFSPSQYFLTVLREIPLSLIHI